MSHKVFSGDDSWTPGTVEMGRLGWIRRDNGLLQSYDTGTQLVGQQLFSQWNFYFLLDADLDQRLIGSISTGQSYNATLNIHIDENTIVGPLGGPYSRPLRSGQYYVKVTTSAGVTNFHFGIIAVPPLSLFPNNAGRTSSTPLYLGELASYLECSNNFYTYFPRAQITDSSGPGPLIPDFGNPTPYAAGPDWYSFRLTKRLRARLETTGSIPGPTYVLHLQDGLRTVWSSGQTIDLNPGPYSLSVYDKQTRIIGGGGGNFDVIRDPTIENFERYQFRLSVTV